MSYFLDIFRNFKMSDNIFSKWNRKKKIDSKRGNDIVRGFFGRYLNGFLIALEWFKVRFLAVNDDKNVFDFLKIL